jgi:hypothetical protein
MIALFIILIMYHVNPTKKCDIIIDYCWLISITTDGNHGKASNWGSHKCTYVFMYSSSYFCPILTKFNILDRF